MPTICEIRRAGAERLQQTLGLMYLSCKIQDHHPCEYLSFSDAPARIE
jgi:hypothetical protein